MTFLQELQSDVGGGVLIVVSHVRGQSRFVFVCLFAETFFVVRVPHFEVGRCATDVYCRCLVMSYGCSVYDIGGGAFARYGAFVWSSAAAPRSSRRFFVT